jgi:hypothetical protein
MGHRCARIAASIARVFYPGMVAASLFAIPAYADDTLPPPSETGASTPHAIRHANDPGWIAPDAVKKMADWVFDSRDNRGLPFVIVDKAEAKVFVFDKSGRILGTAWALVGLARGDDSVPGIGTMPLAQITPDMRTTPAGRFVANLGYDLGKLNVLWVDYPNAVSLHRVINTNPAERRLERIVSQVPAEHRISYGCINVPALFFDSVVDPTFKDTHGIVYILPEVKEMRAVFPAYYDVDDPGRAQAALN